MILPSNKFALSVCLKSIKTLCYTVGLLFAPYLLAANTNVNPIPGVIAEGTQLEFIKDGFDGTEGPIGLPDGSLIFTEYRANRIIRIAADGSTSKFLDNTKGANGLAFNKAGELVAAHLLQPQIGVLYPSGKEKVWVSQFEGKSLQRPNDITINKRGGAYFTDIGLVPKGEVTEPARPGVYYATADGSIKQILNDIERPNGIILSGDEKTLFVANTAGEHILAYPVIGDGKLGPRREFAKLAGYEKGETGAFSSGADGLAIDNKGRLYVASNAGIEIFDNKGKAVGVIPVPQKAQNLAFAGKNKKTLYVVGRGNVFKIAVLTPGYLGRAK